MTIQVSQELCSGCGLCMDSCPVEAIHIVDQKAAIHEALCTQCLACLDACTNGAIMALSMPVRNARLAGLPATSSSDLPVPAQPSLPEKAIPTRSLAPLSGAAPTLLGNKVAPRLLDVLVPALERTIVPAITAAHAPSPVHASNLPTRGSPKLRRARHRGGRTDKKKYNRERR